MKGQTYVILIIIFTIMISVFAVLNIDVVEVNYLFWRGSSPLIFVILFSVLLGGMLTTVVGSSKFIRLRRENKQLREKITTLELEMTNPEKQIDHSSNSDINEETK